MPRLDLLQLDPLGVLRQASILDLPRKRIQWRIFLALIASLLALRSHAAESDLKVVVGPRIRVSPAGVGYHGLADLSMDEPDSGHMIACGYRYSPNQNSTIGYIYLSQDFGRSWREVLKDDSSIWVTEDSCAAGAGRAFFMGESQLHEFDKVLAGVPLDQAGDIHLYRSANAGQSWKLLSRRGWIDSSVMAIDSSKGLHRGRMYLFGADQIEDSSGSHPMPLLFTSDDGKNLHGPVRPADPVGFSYRGAYANSARILSNGHVVAVFMTRRRSAQADKTPVGETHVEIFTTRNGGESVEELADLGPIQPCTGAMPSLDVGAQSKMIYVVWGSLENGRCQLRVRVSVDEGLTWGSPISVSVAPDGYAPAIAVNDRGIVALFWTDRTEYHCWRFSASSDRANTFSLPTQVSRCIPTSKQADLSNSAYATSYVHTNNHKEGWDLNPDAIGFSVVAASDGMIPWRVGLRADSRGGFRAVWPEATDEAGALWTTTIAITSKENDELNAGSEADVSHDIALEFRDSSYDPASATYAVDVTAINRGKRSLNAPIKLIVESAYSRFFSSVSSIGTDQLTRKDDASWTLWPDGGQMLLHPGQRTTSRRLSFHLQSPLSDPIDVGDLLAVTMKALSPQHSE